MPQLLQATPWVEVNLQRRPDRRPLLSAAAPPAPSLQSAPPVQESAPAPARHSPAVRVAAALVIGVLGIYAASHFFNTARRIPPPPARRPPPPTSISSPNAFAPPPHKEKDGRVAMAGKEWQVQAAELKELRKMLADEKARRESESESMKKWEREMQALKAAAAKRQGEEEKQREKQAKDREKTHQAILRRLDGLASSVKAETSDRVSAISGVR